MSQSLSNQQLTGTDFFIDYSWPAHDHDKARKGLLEALSALYYLPKNYKLKVLTTSEAAAKKEIASLVDDKPLIARVFFGAKTQKSHKVSPFSFVISNETSSSPEALASAVLDVARAA
jgi:hypothetical protein